MGERRPVHVVDDDDSVRKAGAFMLRTAGHPVQLGPDGVSFLRHAHAPGDGCVLLDIGLPEMDGLEVQAEMRRRGLRMPVIIVTGHGEVRTAVHAMRNGAIDFLEKPFERDVLLSVIDLAFTRIHHDDDRDRQADDARVRIAGLTPREREVMAGLAAGLPNKTIAFDLGISPRTVEVHRANVMTKLGVDSLSGALRIAFAAGMGRD